MTGIGEGKLHVYTGDGKGKTTAAFGLAMRASGRGLKVLILQFMKGMKDAGEVVASKDLRGVRVEQFGTDRFISEPSEEDKALAMKGIERARKAMRAKEADMLILDELNVALHFKLVTLSDVLGLIAERPKEMELVITGRCAAPEVMEKADYVTEMKARKHPFDSGKGSRPGIEC